MEVSSSAGLNHINNYMHPQAIIVDSSGEEEEFFLRAFRERANAMGTSLIELPKNAEESLMWLTRLDYASLSGAFLLLFNHSSQPILSLPVPFIEESGAKSPSKLPYIAIKFSAVVEMGLESFLFLEPPVYQRVTESFQIWLMIREVPIYWRASYSL